MKKTAGTLVGLIIILVAALAILPSVINWNQYKSEITTKAKEATGRDVVINGDIKLRILPSPSIIVNDAQISNPNNFGSDDAFAQIKKIEIGAALKPLLKKQVHITGVTLESPVIHLQKNGEKTNWDFSNTTTTENKAPVAKSKDSFKPELSFDEINISNASLIYSDGTSEPKKVSPINATLKGSSINGPFNLEGNLIYNKIPANFKASTSEVIKDKPIAIKTIFSADNNNAVVEISANVGGKNNVEKKGKVNLSITNLEKLIGSLNEGKAPALPALLKSKIQASGYIKQSSDGINLDNLEVALGKLNVKGNATYSNDQKLGISLATNTVDLRNKAKISPNTENKTSANKTYNDVIDSAFKSASGFIGTSIPADITAGFELRIKKLITENNIELADVQISALVDDKTVKLSKVSVQLPGVSSLALSATMPLNNQKIDHINADITFKANQTGKALSAFDVKDLPSGFSPMDAQAKIKITKQSLTLTDSVLKFGKNNLNNIRAIYSPQDKTPVQLSISGGDLDFNTLQSKKSDEKTTSEVTTEKNKTIGLSPDVAQKFQGLKASVNVKLDQIIFDQNLARNITINSSIDGEKITLNEASIGDLGDLNSLNIKITGVIGKLSPFDGLDLNINASSDDLSRTLWAFGNKNAGDIGKANLSATIKGSQENVALKADGKIDQGKLTIDGSLKNLANNPVLTGKISANHPETSVVLKNFANMKTQNSKMGPFSMKTKLVASTGKFKTEELVVNMGDQGTIGGHINFDKTVTPGVIDVDLDADLLPLGSLTGAKTNRVGGGTGATAAPKTWSQKSTDLSALRNTSGTIKVNVKKLTYDAFIFDDFSLLADVKNGSLDLQKLAANMFDGSFDVKGVLNAAPTGQSHKGQFNISISKANVEKVFSALGSKAFGGGILSYQQALTFSGANQLGIIKSLNGKGNITVENGSFNGLDLDSLAEKMNRPNSPSDFLAILQQAKAGGTSSFETLEAPISIENGVIKSNDIIVKSEKSQIDLDGFVDLPSQNLKLDGEVSFVEQRNIPGLGLQIYGPLYAPKKKLKTDNILRFYTQKATQDLGQKALNKLFGKPEAQPTEPANDNAVPAEQQPSDATSATDSVAPTETSLETPAETTEQPVETPVQQEPQDVEDVLKEQGEQLLRGLLGG